MTHAFESLTPDTVLDALESVGLRGDGRLTALSSYENRVYQAVLEDGSQVVAKFYRPQRWSEAQLREEHGFSAELMAAEVPAIGPLVLGGQTLHQFAGFSFSVSPRRGGRQPELDDLEVLEWIGRFLARIHTVGAKQPFVARPALNLATFGTESVNWLLENHQVPLDVQSAWTDAAQQALALVAAHPALTDSPAGPIRRIRLHGDCHPGNILWTPEGMPEPGPHFVDMDDARTGPAVQDLWMLVHGEAAERRQKMEIVLEGYESVRRFDRRELQLIEPLRTLRIIHYSAWLAGRQDDPAFPMHFPWFGTSDYWRGQCDTLREQIEAMDPLS